MSLLKELQDLTERTYRERSGINLERFVIGKKRFGALSQLTSPETRELSEAARVFLRVWKNQLFLAIYFSETLIDELERHDPRRGLNEKNIYAFMVFVEEINHAVHGALKFLSGQQEIKNEEFVRDLELLAKIDTYLILKYFLAYFNRSKKLECFDRLWLRFQVFERSDCFYENPILAGRYYETNWLGEKYTRFLDNLPPHERLQEIRRFRKMRYAMKAKYIRLLP